MALLRGEQVGAEGDWSLGQVRRSARSTLGPLRALFFDLGITLPFFPIWLQSHALGPAEIGIILAAPLVARLIANPIVAEFADRRDAVDTTLATSAALVLLATLGLTTVGSFWSILVIVFLLGLAQGPLIALTDAYTWTRLQASIEAGRREHVYGLIRLWGSIGFVVASIGAGRALDWLPPAMIVWCLAAAAAVLTVTAASVARSARHERPPRRSDPDEPFQLRPLALIIVGAALVQSSHATYYAFSSLHWLAEGRSGAQIGLLWSIGVVSEIAFFAVGGRLIWRLGGPLAVLLLAAAASVLRWGIMALDPALAVLVVMQALHAVTFGATHLASVAAISRMAPVRLQARAQGWLAALWAGFMALLTTLSGMLYPSFGARSYLPMAVVAVGGFILFGLARWSRRGALDARMVSRP